MTDIHQLEEPLWTAADNMGSNMDAAEYKPVVFGLIFLKYIEDTFSELYSQLAKGKSEFTGADPEHADEYLAHNVSFAPEKPAGNTCKERQSSVTKLFP